MSDTPRTDAAWSFGGTDSVRMHLSKCLERELADANETISQTCEIIRLMTEKLKAEKQKRTK